MRPRILACILATAMLLTASTATADWFDDFDGGFDQSWDFDHMTLGEDSTSFSFDAVGDLLEVTDPTPVMAGGALVGLGYVDVTFGDTLVYGTLNPNNDNDMNGQLGLFLRGDGDNAYVLMVDYAVGAAAIIKNSEAEGQETLGTPAIISGLQSTDSLYLEFSAAGTSLVGNVYTEPGGTLRGNLSTTDSSFAAGVAGVAVQAVEYGVALRGTFDDVGAVPEPASLVLLTSGGLCVLGCWWRKRRRGKG